MWAILGMLSLPLAIHWAKKDVQSMKTDFKTTVIDDEVSNQNRVKQYFNDICKAVGIKLDKKNRPYHKDQYILGVEFLQYKGHSDKTIDVFYNMFMDRYNDKQKEEEYHMKKNEEKIKNSNGYNIMVFRKDYYGNMNADDRMKKLQEQTWGDMVYQSRYIHGMNGNAKYTEVWTLKVPMCFQRKDLKQLYKEACTQANIDYGNFM